MTEDQNVLRKLHNVIPNAWELRQINDILFHDIILPLEGKALRRKHQTSGYGGYGYIKIRILHSHETSSYSSCKWLITEKEIPLKYRENVEKVLSFFITYISALREDSLRLDFEIIDGSYRPSDSVGWDYEYVTLQAIINAFDKNLYITDHSKIFKNK